MAHTNSLAGPLKGRPFGHQHPIFSTTPLPQAPFIRQVPALKFLSVVGQGRLVLLRRLYRLDGAPIGLATTWLPLAAGKVAWRDAETHFTYHILQDGVMVSGIGE